MAHRLLHSGLGVAMTDTLPREDDPVRETSADLVLVWAVQEELFLADDGALLLIARAETADARRSSPDGLTRTLAHVVGEWGLGRRVPPSPRAASGGPGPAPTVPPRRSVRDSWRHRVGRGLDRMRAALRRRLG